MATEIGLPIIPPNSTFIQEMIRIEDIDQTDPRGIADVQVAARAWMREQWMEHATEDERASYAPWYYTEEFDRGHFVAKLTGYKPA